MTGSWAHALLAACLALLPLHALPARSPGSGEVPVGVEGGMGSRVLVMVESGARLPAPSLGLLLLLPPVPLAGRLPRPRPDRHGAAPAAAVARRAHLVELGRLLLEGG